MKKILITLFVVSLSLLSCENDINSDDKSIDNRHLTNRSIDDDLRIFAKEHVSISEEILILLKNSESNLSFDNNSYIECLNLTTEENVIEYFQHKGVQEPKLLVEKVKQLKSNYELLLINSSIFKDLSNDDKKIKIEESLIKAMDLSPYFSIDSNVNLKTDANCTEQYNTDIKRCNRNQAIGLGFSFVGGVLTGGVGGWLGAAASTTAYHFCVEDAIEDFNNCRKK